MSTYLVGYDLDKPGQKYKNLEEEIKALGAWWHHLDSTWLVVSELSTTQVRDRLQQHIDANDKLIVVRVTGTEAAWYGFSEEGGQWIKDNL
jgi:hypothetical protein